jgi:hypothetical protein
MQMLRTACCAVVHTIHAWDMQPSELWGLHGCMGRRNYDLCCSFRASVEAQLSSCCARCAFAHRHTSTHTHMWAVVRSTLHASAHNVAGWGWQAPSPPTHLHVRTRTSRALVCDRLAHASPDISTCRVHAVARHWRWELCAVGVGRCASNTLGCGWLHREPARAPPSPSNTALLV